MKLTRKNVVCDFCGRSADNVIHMIESKNAFICDICIEKATKIIKAHPVLITEQ